MATLLFLILLLAAPDALAAEGKPLSVGVMDPLAGPLACDCVKGYAQRKYELLGIHLQQQLGRPVEVVFDEDVAGVIRNMKQPRVDLIIGKDSVVRADAAELGLPIEPIAMLTDKEGKTTLTGLFVVRAADPAKVLGDLKGYRFFFGPKSSVEKNAAAIASLKKIGIPVPKKLEVFDGCSEAGIACIENKGKPAAAVISSYAMALLEGCGTIKKGELRVVGETEPVPFIAAFTTPSVKPALRKKIADALISMKNNPEMLIQMETQQGFLPVEKKDGKKGDAKPNGGKKPIPAADSLDPTAVVPGEPLKEWLQWRGPRRNALVPWLPENLAKATVVWTRPMTGSGHAGIVATQKVVVVADRDRSDRLDVWRCLDAANGEQLWQFQNLAPGNLDYGNSPRATPVIRGGRIYLLGAFGDLACLNLADGSVIWKTNVLERFGAKRPTWGMCGSLLIVDDKLIVNPGAKTAGVVALDPANGKLVWQTPGFEAGYSSFIVGVFGGVRQIVGYDKLSLGGWDPKTGRRLWGLIPPERGDFNVPTPIDLGGKLFVVTENNGARVYGFSQGGKIIAEPLAHYEDFSPDTSTPVVVDGRMYGAYGEFYCLDTRNGLKPLWTAEDDSFGSHTSIIATRDRLLLVSAFGELVLLNITRDGYTLIARKPIFAEDSEVLSHPALAGRRIYIRDGMTLKCIDLAG